MRYIILSLIACCMALLSHAQQGAAATTEDTIPPYIKSPIVPSFSLLTPDSTWFFNAGLQEDKPVLILYFSPDCGHCQLETEHLITKMDSLKNLQIVMVTSRPYEDMKAFAEKYKLDKFSNLHIGTDPAKRFSRFYRIEFTPFSALYDKQGSLVKVYRKGVDVTELISKVY